jgi:hypothetical protein
LISSRLIKRFANCVKTSAWSSAIQSLAAPDRLQNLIEAPCRVLGLSKDQAMARAEELLERLRLKPTAIVIRCIFPAAAAACGHCPRPDDGAAGSAV